MFGVLAGIMGEIGSVFGAAFLGLLTLTLAFKGEAIAERLDVGPAVDVIEHTTSGLTDREVEEFSVLHQEYLKMKDEKREEMQKEARKKGGQGRQLNKR